MSFKERLLDGVDCKDWLQILDTPELDTIIDSIESETDLTPVCEDIFNFAKWTPISKIKVVIIGQDPYPTRGDAHGLSFSSEAKNIPSSLRAIYKCLLNYNLLSKMPKISNLTGWAYQGVLLLNRSLTTIVGESNSHKKIWKDYTTEIIKKLCKYADNNNRKYIWMLWGKDARELNAAIDKHHYVMEYTHPSPLADSRLSEESKFANCNHFKSANEILKGDNLQPIDWNPYVCVEMYSDGSCADNGTAKADAGYAVYKPKCGYYPEITIKGKLKADEAQTNNRAEGYAIYHALKLIDELPLAYKAKIYTDSKFWIGMLESYIPAWIAKSPDHYKTKQNPDMTMLVYNMYKKVQERTNLYIVHIEAHIGKVTASHKHGGNPIRYEHNNLVDKLANEARMKCKPGEIVRIEK